MGLTGDLYLDLLGCSLVDFFLEFGIEKNLLKLFNRLTILEKKKYTEKKLFDFLDNRGFFSKVLLDQEKILNEEFLKKGVFDKSP